MNRLSMATPCPPGPPRYHHDVASGCDSTVDIRNPVRHAAPRRIHRPGHTDGFEVFEDESATVLGARVSSASKRNPVLSLPAQRPARRRDTISAPPARRPASGIVASSLLELSKHSRSKDTSNPTISTECELRPPKPFLAERNPRRRTVYVPSEDTTVITIHPGAASRRARAKSPDFGLDLVTLSEEDTTDLKPAIRQTQKILRQETSAQPPKKPLKQNRHILPKNTTLSDIPGPPTGKENVPPGKPDQKNSLQKTPALLPSEKPSPWDSRQAHKLHSSRRSSIAVRPRRVSIAPGKMSHTSSHGILDYAHKNNKSVHWHSAAEVRMAKPLSNISSNSGITPPRKHGHPPQKPLSPYHPTKSPPAALRRHRPDIVSQKRRNLFVRDSTTQPKQKYPLLAEDLSKPEMYEEYWLEYQEIALTQLINGVLSSSSKRVSMRESALDLRKRLLRIYQSSSMAMLYKRLQASLAFGALKPPRGLVPSLRDDVGLREKFLGLLLDSYHLQSLRAALEVVTGREIPELAPVPKTENSHDRKEQQHRQERKSLEGFITAILVKNEDGVCLRTNPVTIGGIARGYDNHDEDFGSPIWNWRKTMLRTLMLILLLDMAKDTGQISSCIFQATSRIKSSIEVLKAVSNLLLPSLGDITKALGHLSYHLRHKQLPFEDYNYKVSNIATDFRNGILLTRLIEILLYPPSLATSGDSDTVTAVTSDSDVLPSNMGQGDSWLLSPHLKFPCSTHASMLYNVQFALSSLKVAGDVVQKASENVRADEIVNGHREKTLSLLWTLVGNLGLVRLVDWHEIKREIARLQLDFCDPNEREDDPQLNGVEQYKTLLQQWACAIAHAHGFGMSNLTTSFADGKIFEAIVDEYLPSGGNPNDIYPSEQRRSANPLAAKLKTLGCSNTFTSLFAPTSSASSGQRPIPSADFTITSLAFFASRLLPLNISRRAATTIQRWYRLHLARREVTKRVVLMRLATHCATIVRTREKVVGAAVVIQRAWRMLLRRRIQMLVDDIVKFQSAARRWKVRNEIFQGVGPRKQARIRGGW